ncbi:helix-turn-helix domain-containing protein [Longispora urticae]
MTRLREHRERLGWTKARLAFALERAASDLGTTVAARRSLLRMISHWENGHREPSEPYRILFPVVYGVPPSALDLEAGSGRPGSRLGLGYHASLAATLTVMEELSRYDLLGHTAVVRGRFSPDAQNAAVLDWMFSSPDLDLPRSSHRVTERHVLEVRATTQAFDRLDRQFGGAHSRELAARYLHDAVVPMLRGQCADSVGRDVFGAAAALCELIGWMAYDSGQHSLAQRYFTQGLRMASQAGDVAYGAFILASMGHQALYLGQPAQALRLAQAAYDRSSRTTSAAMATDAAFLAARAYSELGDAPGCTRSLARADNTYQRIRRGEEPDWAAKIDDAVFASHAGTCWTTLGRTTEALPLLHTVWQLSVDQPRRRAYAAVQLATAAHHEGDIERAGTLGIQAVEAISLAASARSQHELRQLLHRLDPQKAHPAIRDLRERARIVLTD